MSTGPLTPLEIAVGLALGPATTVRLPESASAPLEELDRAMLPALLRPPCLVSFSGGRDSSCVLAAAVRLARQEGLQLPVPVTLRFPRAEGTDESDWQERVVGHLGLADWARLDLDDELDPVGPVARRVLERHGLLWPFNAHFHVPVLERAAGGSVLTGIGGDEAFGESRWHHANAILARAVRPAPRDVLPLGLALSPAFLRRRVLRRRSGAFGWLTAEGRAATARALGAHQAAEPRTYRPRLEWWLGLRATHLGFGALSRLAADADVEIAHPLAHPGFAAALARVAPRGGPARRGDFMREIFGELLPDEVYRRSTKVVFDTAFWARHARELAAGWSGEGADAGLVDAEALRAEWSKPVPDAHTFTLLQSAWLDRRSRRGPVAAPPSPGAARPTSAGGAAPTRAAPPA